MQTEHDNNERMKSLRIDAELYEKLRAYCDQNDIRFIEFIQEALENATHLDHITEILADEGRVKERIEEEQRVSVRYGFKRGLLAALLALDGKLELSWDMTPIEVRKQLPIKTVKGDQLPLFDTDTPHKR